MAKVKLGLKLPCLLRSNIQLSFAWSGPDEIKEDDKTQFVDSKGFQTLSKLNTTH